MKKQIKLKNYIIFLILFLELTFKILIIKNTKIEDIILTIVLSMPIILLIDIICNIFTNKISKVITIIISILIIFYFLVQVIFYKLFSVPFSFSTLGLAENVLDFTDIIIDAIKSHLLYILIFTIPIIIFFIINKKIEYKKYNYKKVLKTLGITLIWLILSIGIINLDKSGTYSSYNLYYKIDAIEKNIQKFGLLTATRIDIKRTILGFNDNIIIQTNANIDKNKNREYNIIDINFEEIKNNETDDNLINIYTYIENTKPTQQNEYTGYFKDKNLIFILAEGFNNIAVDENLTPTLYKLANSGFVFENFYSPVFLSTTGGEFQATTGLIPTQATLKMWKNNKPQISFALGNSFSKIGYAVNAYHNWTYDYYSREKTMPTIGFNSYMGIGNGLEKLMNSKWLPSDIDLINVTTDFYTGEEKFITYYVTVSGHAPYVMTNGNSIAYKNKELVANLNYPNTIKAYLATQIELDKALELLIEKLTLTGKLENTVIALVGDHYPYTISLEDINRISTYQRDEIVEINRSNFILWNTEMENPIKIEKVGSQIDVLPTLLNLFGIQYDSRLIIGQDILSDKEGIAIFSNRSWVTDSGTYFSANGEFKAKEGKEVSEEYINNINVEVANKFTMSNLFIKYNIYEKLLNKF